MDTLFNGETIYLIPENIQLFNSDNVDIAAYVLAQTQDLNSAGKELLTQILNAINLKFNQNAHLIALEEGRSVKLSSLPIEVKEKVLVIAFGIDLKSLGLQIQPSLYTMLPFEKFNLILSHSLQDLIKEKQYKGQLWNSIKHLKF